AGLFWYGRENAHFTHEGRALAARRPHSHPAARSDRSGRNHAGPSDGAERGRERRQGRNGRRSLRAEIARLDGPRPAGRCAPEVEGQRAGADAGESQRERRDASADDAARLGLPDPTNRGGGSGALESRGRRKEGWRTRPASLSAPTSLLIG